MCVWVEDADKLDINSSELGILYANRTIKSYLSKNNNYPGIAGVKGQGKTFLIKVKRKQISEDPGIICLPHDKMVDSLDSSFPIDDSLFNYLVDYNVWVDLWKYSICVTLIQHYSVDTKLDGLELDYETKQQIAYDNPNFTPSLIFCNMLRLNIKDFITAIEDTGKLMEVIGRIHNGVCVFFDKIDQGLTKFFTANMHNSRMPKRERIADFWAFGQLALAECAYDISNKNNHIKIYYTIRQETLHYVRIPNQNKARNIMANILVLKYSKDDLRNMYNTYIEHETDENLLFPSYKKTSPSKAFLGVEEFPHGYVYNTSETVFDYIFRHSFHRPYDFMRICLQLYLQEAKEIEDIRHIVNKYSDEIFHMYLNELEIFIPYSIPDIEAFIRNIPGNIIDDNIVHMVCNAFFTASATTSSNGLSITSLGDTSTGMGVSICAECCESCEYSHPFSVLYSLGLIGRVKQNPADKVPKQEFRNIGDGITIEPLPRSQFYLLHPAVSNYVRDTRKDRGFPFLNNKDVLVGDACAVSYEMMPKLNAHIWDCGDAFIHQRIFVSSTVNDLKELRFRIREHLRARWLIPVMSDYPDFNIRKASNVHSHDLCLDEVLTCKNMVFIMGMEYGGVYAGTKYMKYADEIKERSNGKIKEPSVSLMEYYVARRNDIMVYAYRSEEVEIAHRAKKIDEQQRAEINFINHFTTPEKKSVHGNWITTYQSEDDLISRIDIIKFFDRGNLQNMAGSDEENARFAEQL